MIDTNAATRDDLLRELRKPGPVYILAGVGDAENHHRAYQRVHKHALAADVRRHGSRTTYSVTREAGGLYIG